MKRPNQLIEVLGLIRQILSEHQVILAARCGRNIFSLEKTGGIYSAGTKGIGYLCARV